MIWDPFIHFFQRPYGRQQNCFNSLDTDRRDAIVDIHKGKRPRDRYTFVFFSHCLI